MGFDVARPQPACKPKAVATGFEGDSDARDRLPRFGRFGLPTAQKSQEVRLVGSDLLERVAVDPRHDGRDEPTCLAHLDNGDKGAGLIQGQKGSAQVMMLWHGRLQG